MSVGYRRQGYPIINVLFTDTGKPSASVFCANFLDKTGTLSSLSGVYTAPYIDSIEFTD